MGGMSVGPGVFERVTSSREAGPGLVPISLVLLNQHKTAGQRPTGPICVADAWQESRSMRAGSALGSLLGAVVGST